MSKKGIFESIPFNQCFCIPTSFDKKRFRSKSQSTNKDHDRIEIFLNEFWELYHEKLLPLEMKYKFDSFVSPFLKFEEFTLTPTILVLGPTSSGKTSLIQFLLNSNYYGMKIGPEQTTSDFKILTYGEDERIIPGNVLVSDRTKPFKSLSAYGNIFLDKLQGIESSNEFLKKLNIIDTPGVIFSNDKNESYFEAINWFAEKADLILFTLDASNSDLSIQTKRYLYHLQKYENKLRIIINKADM